MIRLTLLSLAALIVAAFSCAAHEEASWIQRGRYLNAVGELCCGERDCKQLADDDVSIVPGGFYIRSIEEFVPISEAQPFSPGGYWICIWGGQRKCFFYSPPGS